VRLLAVALNLTCCVVICMADDAAVPALSEKTHWVREVLETPGPCGLKVLAAEEVAGGVEVICSLRYPDIRGTVVEGKAKVYLPGRLQTDRGTRAPLVHVAGYEAERGGGEGFIGQGFIVSTPHAEPDNPLVRGENIDVAILHRMRALPFVDDARVIILGGSAGGYMTLLLAAETFPLSCCAPDVPPVNLGYNVAYLMHNKALAAAQPEGQDHPNMPVLNVVTPLGDMCSAIYGTDYDADAWMAASPLGRMDEITCPAIITCSTADILVPADQFGAAMVRPEDAGQFPQGFEMRMGALLSRQSSRRTLVETLEAGEVEVFTVPAPAAPRNGWDGAPEGGAAPVNLPLPFSKDKRVSLVVVDEGAPEPSCGHTKYAIGLDKIAFLLHYYTLPIAPEQLTEAKLRRLMQRYLHVEGHPALVQPPGSPAPFAANRLDLEQAEKADVLRGLRTYAEEPACAAKLSELYRALPAELKALGPEVDVEGLVRGE